MGVAAQRVDYEGLPNCRSWGTAISLLNILSNYSPKSSQDTTLEALRAEGGSLETHQDITPENPDAAQRGGFMAVHRLNPPAVPPCGMAARSSCSHSTSSRLTDRQGS